MSTATEYRLWYDFLQISDRKRWSKRVKQHFTAADGLPFDQWWEQCKHLFMPDYELQTVVNINSRNELTDLWETFKSEDLGDSLFLYVDLNSPRNALTASFEQLLNEHHQGVRGRPSRSSYDAEFELAAVVNVNAAQKALQVWKYRRDHPNATLWKIGTDCKIKVGQRLVAEPDDVQRRVLASTVSRYLARADKLIEGVERGVFPLR